MDFNINDCINKTKAEFGLSPNIGTEIGQSPNVANTFPGGTVFKNSGPSHITFDNGTAHISTSIKGLGNGEEGANAAKEFTRMNVDAYGNLY